MNLQRIYDCPPLWNLWNPAKILINFNHLWGAHSRNSDAGLTFSLLILKAPPRNLTCVKFQPRGVPETSRTPSLHAPENWRKMSRILGFLRSPNWTPSYEDWFVKIRLHGVLLTQTLPNRRFATPRSSGWLRWIAEMNLLRFKKNPDGKYFFIMEKIKFENFSAAHFGNSFRRNEISFVNGLQRKFRFA